MRELREAAAPGDIVVTGALGLSLTPPLSVLCSASTPAEAVIPAAAALARSAGRRVEIVLLDGNDEAARRWEEAARALLAAQGGRLELRLAPADRARDEKRAKGGPTRGNR
jgi:hypothetical protein